MLTEKQLKEILQRNMRAVGGDASLDDVPVLAAEVLKLFPLMGKRRQSRILLIWYDYEHKYIEEYHRLSEKYSSEKLEWARGATHLSLRERARRLKMHHVCLMRKLGKCK